MALYKKVKLTTLGKNLLNDLMNSSLSLEFTGMKTTDRLYLESEIESLTTIEDVKQSTSVYIQERMNETTTRVESLLSNENLTESYQIQSIGTYANDIQGQEVLVGVATAEEPFYMYSHEEGMPTAAIFNLHIGIGDTELAILETNPSGAASLADVIRLDDSIKEVAGSVTTLNTELTKVGERILDLEAKDTQLESAISNNKEATNQQIGVLTEEVGKKADKTEVNELANLKADKTYVDVEHGKVTAQLAQKANNDTFEDYRDATGASLSAIIAKYELEPMPDPVYVENLWDVDDTVFGVLNENNGNLNAHETTRTSNFREYVADTDYTFYVYPLIGSTVSGIKVVFYDDMDVIIDGYGWEFLSNSSVTYRSPSVPGKMRISVDRNGVNDFIANIGSKTVFPDDEGGVFDGGFWESVPSPPLRERSVKNFHVNDGAISSEKTDFFEAGKNLFNKDSVVLNKSFDNVTGELVDDVRWTSLDFIPVTQGEIISLNADSALRVATYREDFSFISRSGTTAPPTKYTSTSSIARYIRFSGVHDPELLMINRGEELLPYEPYGSVIKSELLPKSKAEDIDTTTIKEDIINELAYINAKNPYPPKLSNLIEVHQGPETPLWLSGDGEVLFGRGRQGAMPVMSTDEWETHQQIGMSNLPAYIYGMRELPSGELMASVSRNESLDIRAKVFKTTGFDRSDPSTAVWNEVLEVGSRLANVQNSWGFDSYGDIVVIAEYGLQGIDGSRYVYLSTDGGNEFTQIFDLVNEIVEGRPNWDSDAHLHTVAYDPYFSRIWLCVGDGLNSATYYTDNYGGKWEHVEQETAMQYTGIIAMEDSVIFGSDRAPNGLYIYRRKDKADKVKINPWHILNDERGISQIFQLPFRKDRNKGTPVYFNATSSKQANDPNETVVMAFIDGKKAHLIYQSEPIHSLTNGPGVTAALGDTAQGNLMLVVNMPDQSGSTTYKVAAPIWE